MADETLTLKRGVDPLTGLDMSKYRELSERVDELNAQRSAMIKSACPARVGDLIEFQIGTDLPMQGRVGYVGVSLGASASITPSWTLNVRGIHVRAENFIRVVERAEMSKESNNG